MIRPSEMHDELLAMDRLNLGTFKTGSAELWAETLTEALPTVTAPQVHRALIRLAGQRNTETRGAFLTPADLIATVQGITNEDAAKRRARIAAVPLSDYPEYPPDLEGIDYLVFRRAFVDAIGNGHTTHVATLAAWEAINRTPPPPQLTRTYDTQTLTGDHQWAQ